MIGIVLGFVCSAILTTVVHLVAGLTVDVNRVSDPSPIGYVILAHFYFFGIVPALLGLLNYAYPIFFNTKMVLVLLALSFLGCYGCYNAYQKYAFHRILSNSEKENLLSDFERLSDISDKIDNIDPKLRSSLFPINYGYEFRAEGFSARETIQQLAPHLSLPAKIMGVGDYKDQMIFLFVDAAGMARTEYFNMSDLEWCRRTNIIPSRLYHFFVPTD